MITKFECKADVQNHKFGWVLVGGYFFRIGRKNKVKLNSKLIKCLGTYFSKDIFQ